MLNKHCKALAEVLKSRVVDAPQQTQSSSLTPSTLINSTAPVKLFYVHYIDYNKRLDEWVTIERMKIEKIQPPPQSASAAAAALAASNALQQQQQQQQIAANQDQSSRAPCDLNDTNNETPNQKRKRKNPPSLTQTCPSPSSHLAHSLSSATIKAETSSKLNNNNSTTNTNVQIVLESQSESLIKKETTSLEDQAASSVAEKGLDAG